MIRELIRYFQSNQLGVLAISKYCISDSKNNRCCKSGADLRCLIFNGNRAVGIEEYQGDEASTGQNKGEGVTVWPPLHQPHRVGVGSGGRGRWVRRAAQSGAAGLCAAATEWLHCVIPGYFPQFGGHIYCPIWSNGTPRRKPSACLGHGGIIAVTAACRVFSRASAVRMQCPDRPLGTAVWRTLLGCKYNGASRSHAHVTERRGSSGDESLLVTGKVSYFLGKLRVT